ncbi:MAG: hypothetical protein ACE5JH_12240, partial [Acidobacteriota bacterium]
KLLEAIEVMDALYWKQMGRQALEARRAFEDASDPVDRLYREFVMINYGPYDIRNGMEPFIDLGGWGERPPGAGFYPEDMSRREFEAHLAAHPALREEFERFNTLIRRIDGTLVAVPFEKVYVDELARAARALREAARLVPGPSLRRYLSLRAEALLGGDYYRSDLAWLEVRDNLLDVVIGPIETYDDALFGYKASYEGAVLVKDVARSRALEVYKEHLPGMSRSLPVEERFRRSSAASGNVLEVVNVVKFAGDFNAGIKTVAASLPNDERVIQEKGAKKQIYKNVLEAKFETILEPIARLFLRRGAWPLVTREAFVTNVLMHELAHTLGVDYVAGQEHLTVRRALKERYSPIEEAKADVVGIYSLQYLRDQGVFTKGEIRECYATYLAGIFRSIRFGAEEAHGKGVAVQLNHLMNEGGIEYDAKSGLFSVHRRRFEPALTRLAGELLEIEGTGDYERAGALLDRFGGISPEVEKALGRTADVPVDVTFTYPM